MHDGVDVGAEPHDLEMDRVLDVSTGRAFEHLPFPREQVNVALFNFIETEVAALEPKAASLLVAKGYVSPDHVGLFGCFEDTTSGDDLSLR
jgi:hypothetical protein